MSDFLNTTLTGLLAFQRGLATTSHNIANVNTEGYSRQRVNLTALPPNSAPGLVIGRGVQVASINRVLNELQVTQVRDNQSEQQRLGMLAEQSGLLDNVLASEDAGLAPALAEFANGLQLLADDPASITARQSLLSQARTLEQRFHTLSNRIESQSRDIESQINASLSQVNALASSVAELNRGIVEATAAAGGNPPNDLLDQRDLALSDLSTLLGVQVVAQDDGSLNVFVGNGQAIVLGNEANQLVPQRSSFKRRAE